MTDGDSPRAGLIGKAHVVELHLGEPEPDRLLRQQAGILREALSLVADGKLRVQHAATFALGEVEKAHSFLESGKAVGKVTLQIG